MEAESRTLVLAVEGKQLALRYRVVASCRPLSHPRDPIAVSNELLRRGERVGDGTGRIAASADELWRPLVVIMMIFQAYGKRLGAN